MRSLLYLLLLLPLSSIGQYKITGRVLNAVDNKPIDKASVLLNNTTIGTASIANGGFSLVNVKGGKYEIVISAVGYEAYMGNVFIDGADIDLKDIKLISKSIVLNEVNVRPDAEWFAKFDAFKREFIGSSKLASKCKILNPEILDLEYSDNKLVLKASTDDFLIIENEQLGYRIKYLLKEFVRDNRNRMLFYAGSTLFQEMKGTASQKKKWRKNRLKVYEGSQVHFLRSAIGNRLADEHFEVLRLVRDTTKGKGIFNRVQYLVKQPLAVTDYIKHTDQRTLFALQFKDCLYVMYKRRRNSEENKWAMNLKEAPKHEASIIDIREEYAVFDLNGVITDPHSVINEGTWATQRIAELLPVNYEPPIDD
ncbi:carboxypeptidase-like regulatory domain-containing protein [Mucilaginibacter sp. UR6-1]|uniref:carboxypeptidase-like regulatory domain-containing protein n=1 Tax=Mucilaginibacter sp. UR6-1 TaxID=1435643 RepID=UPI001E5294F5|nr:carboxypeptidase-like regulatory domain-containing protein [Mucilaginibacter sp. UR6-1]MCC8411209.1 carboxypeptidase-like regulatory domain-containing protein [Mucilaginibacter sp. UR6-1]